jgi:two-component system sensor histidine kinase HydH
MATIRRAPLSRWAWAVVAIVVLMGGALLTTVWTTYAGVRDASAILLRGQADALQDAVRAELVGVDGPPSSEDLAAFLDEQKGAGLRYIAVLDAAGLVGAGAGTPAAGPPEPGQPRDAPAVVDGRVRLQFRVFGPRRFRRDMARPTQVILEFEPVQAEGLRRAAWRTLGIGALAATMLLGVAIALVRWALRREARERDMERARRLASLGELSAVLAHEIRNPLASLKGNAQLLAAQLPEGDRSRQKADRVVGEAVRLETLTNDLLDFVRTAEIRRADVDPTALLRESAAGVDAGAIAVDGAAAPATWPLDRDRLRQALVNLLENAVQAGPPVRARVAQTGGKLVFEVSDAGPGVPAEDKERIFEPFFTQREGGTGLGLAVAKRVVELHRGTITVADAPGGGAVFRVELPPA